MGGKTLEGQETVYCREKQLQGTDKIAEFLPCLSWVNNHNTVHKISTNVFFIFPSLCLAGLPEVRRDLLAEAATEGLPGGGDPEAQ